MRVEPATVRSVLTRTSGYLRGVTSHSLQPYRGCPYGLSLCGVGCYVRHHAWVLRGRSWGTFLEARENAAGSYLEHAGRERRWARRSRGGFGVFLSSSTEPFPPQERERGITRSVLDAMLREPPDTLVLQTHSDAPAAHGELLGELARRCELRVHISVETDRERVPGLPPHARPVSARLEAAGTLRAAGIRTVVTVAPLLPIARPEAFFRRIGEVADAVVVDHFVEGDGTADGRRTRTTPLPGAMERLEAGSSSLAYRDRMAAVARRVLPGRVGIGAEGFAGRLLP